MIVQKSLTIRTRGRELYEVTDAVQEIVAACGIVAGIVNLFLHHTSASLILCENAERPRRVAQLLLIENARGELLLERRPNRGIWGGLWCPPVVAGRAPGATVLERLPPIRHAFTHYDLELCPVRVRARRTRRGDWVTLRALSRYGLPAPVRKLLMSL
jgi:adenine-specific DNA glycosylase